MRFLAGLSMSIMIVVVISPVLQVASTYWIQWLDLSV
jgi:hypothetical protein